MPPRARCCLVLAVLLVSFVPASAARASAQQQSGVNPYYEFLNARRLLGEGDAKGALAALERALAADPESAGRIRPGRRPASRSRRLRAMRIRARPPSRR